MADKTFNVRIKCKRDTESNWQTANPVLKSGELAVSELSENKVKLKAGDGAKSYSLLPFISTRTDDLLETGEMHNGIFRGADLTSVYNPTQLHEKMSSGDFSNLYLGDYFRMGSSTLTLYIKFAGEAFESGVTYYERSGTYPNWTYTATSDTVYDSAKTYYTKSVTQVAESSVNMMIADFDYYYNVGDQTASLVNYHHIVLVPQTKMSVDAPMNPTRIVSGGYYGSEMHQTTLPCYYQFLKTGIPQDYLKTWRDRLSSGVNTNYASMAGANLKGAVSANTWQTTSIRLMSEEMLFGGRIFSSSALDVGCANRQLSVFKFISPVKYGRDAFWTSAVASSERFSYITNAGLSHYQNADSPSGVRPLVIFG